MNDNNFNYDENLEELNTNEEIILTEQFEEKDKNLKPMLSRLAWAMTIYILSSQLIAGLVMNFLDLGSSMIISVIVALFILAFIKKDKPMKSLISYKNKDFKIQDIFFYLGLMMILNIIFSNITNLFMNNFDIQSVDIMEMITGLINPVLFLYVVIIGPIIEELVYRGYLLQSLKDYSKQAAIIISTLAFAFMHGNIEQSLTVLGLSFVLNYVGIFYSWRFALVLHFINNLQSIVLSYLILKMGPEALPVMIMTFIIFIVIAYAIFKLIRGRFKEFSQNLKADEFDKRYKNKILFSVPMIILILLYIGLMVLTQFIQ